MPTPEDRLFHAIWGQPVVMYDRRASPSRRASWRGGRRDSDWTNRPPGAMEKLERRYRRMSRLRNVLMSLW